MVSFFVVFKIDLSKTIVNSRSYSRRVCAQKIIRCTLPGNHLSLSAKVLILQIDNIQYDADRSCDFSSGNFPREWCGGLLNTTAIVPSEIFRDSSLWLIISRTFETLDVFSSSRNTTTFHGHLCARFSKWLVITYCVSCPAPESSDTNSHSSTKGLAEIWTGSLDSPQK